VSLNFVCSKYAAAAKEEEKISSAGTSRPRESNFFLYPLRDFVELLVTKKVFLPRVRSLASVSGMPSITESPYLFRVHNIILCVVLVLANNRYTQHTVLRQLLLS